MPDERCPQMMVKPLRHGEALEFDEQKLPPACQRCKLIGWTKASNADEIVSKVVPVKQEPTAFDEQFAYLESRIAFIDNLLRKATDTETQYGPAHTAQRVAQYTYKCVINADN